MTAIRYGAFVPQGWKLEYQGLEASDAWARSVEIAQRAEEVGYDHLWVYDHVETIPKRRPTHVFEAFTMLAALSQRTTRTRLGQLVTCSAYRNVGLLAKEAACLDVMSGGRLILGLGAGWYEREYRAYGWEFPTPGERLERLDETAQAVRMLWTEDRTTFEGKHVRFDGALCDPKPLQALPPIWIGGGGGEGDAPRGGPSRQRHELAGGAGGLRPEVGGSPTSLRGGGARLRRHHPHPRS